MATMGARDVRLLFAARFLRLFAFGLLSVVLVLYLAAIGTAAGIIGALLALALFGDTALSMVLSARADRFGRRRVLILGAALMVLAASLLAWGAPLAVLVLAALFGVVSPSGNEAGPFQSVEQAALAGCFDSRDRTRAFAWYNLAGSAGTALGALAAGLLVALGQSLGLSGADPYVPVLAVYAACGLALAVMFSRLTQRVEVSRDRVAPPPPSWHGLHHSGPLVGRIARLFALDAFGGGLVVQSFIAYWLVWRHDAGAGALGALFMATNVLSGASYLGAGWLAQRIGLVRTMVFTHIPANLLLMLVPLMPDFPTVSAVLLLRATVTQMDVPTRQAYLMAVVRDDERSAAAGVTAMARSLGAAASPALAMALVGSAALASVPFYLAGGLKIIYDLALYRALADVRPEHERL